MVTNARYKILECPHWRDEVLKENETFEYSLISAQLSICLRCKVKLRKLIINYKGGTPNGNVI